VPVYPTAYSFTEDAVFPVYVTAMHIEAVLPGFRPETLNLAAPLSSSWMATRPDVHE
jgi:hypothetical protein